MTPGKRATGWTTPTSWEEVCRRASGRRRYNAVRQVRAEVRRVRLMELARRWGMPPTVHRFRARAARELGVHRSTVSRDVQRLVERWREERRCQCCGSVLLPRTAS